MKNTILATFFDSVSVFFLIYMLCYATYLLISVVLGAWKLYQRDRMLHIKNELKHPFYLPVSVLVPAYNEEVTILDSVESLLNLDYKLYEIIVVDDGSKDQTSQVLIDHFGMQQVNRPIHKLIPCQMQEAVYEAPDTRVKLTLIRKKNGGKGDALNMGINASRYPYFLCLDADSMLQRDSLERIVQPVMEDDTVVAVGGQVRVAQCVELRDGRVVSARMPWNPLVAMQAIEYDRSFLASRLLMDTFNGNLIISGAFGLFNKSVAVAAGGYDTNTLGEDMELVVKLHAFCRTNQRPYSIRYEPNAVCWSQAPSSLRDLCKQRRRWHLGLFQCLAKYRNMLFNSRFGLVGFISYLYYFIYELASPIIEIFGLITMLVAWLTGLLNAPFMIRFFLLYAVYGILLTVTAFFQRIYTQHLKTTPLDIFKACLTSLIESIFYHFVLAYVRATAFFGYKTRKKQWGEIKRQKQNESAA